MKKILFTLLLVASSLTMNAQTVGTIEFQLFDSGSSTYALASGHEINDACVTVKDAANGDNAISSVGPMFTYTIDANGQVQRNGVNLGPPNARLVATYQRGGFNRLYTRSSAGFGSPVNLTDSQ